MSFLDKLANEFFIGSHWPDGVIVLEKDIVVKIGEVNE